MRKACNFNCVYCQLGPTRLLTRERQVFIRAEELARELKDVGEIGLDYITFSGVAEPTLAANLAELIGVVRAVLPGRPLAILTNSAFIPREDVRRDLALFDTVVAKIDAPDESLFHKINRPLVRVSLEEIVEGIRIFRQSFRGKMKSSSTLPCAPAPSRLLARKRWRKSKRPSLACPSSTSIKPNAQRSCLWTKKTQDAGGQ